MSAKTPSASGRYERHVFVCLNERAPDHPRGCCLDKDAQQVHAQLKAAIKARGLQREVRINRSGCLDTCEYGVSLVVYPENVWYGRVQPEDVPEIVESHLVGGVPVHRLILERPQLRPWEA